MVNERIQRRIERLLVEADDAVDQQDWPLVLDRARQVLILDPDNEDGRTYPSIAERGLQVSPVHAQAPVTEPLRHTCIARHLGAAASILAEPEERVEALEHLDFAIAEFRDMKMQPSLERALKHKRLLHA